MNELIHTILTTLLNQWLWDVSVFSTELWMYYCLCVPALCFLMFFLLKWSVLTAPLWIPFTIVFRLLIALVYATRGK